MKITTLLENKTTCDALRCEHGLSLYIETEKHKIFRRRPSVITMS